MKHIIRHLPHYTSLLGVLGAGLVAFIIFSNDYLFQSAVAFAVAASYVSWGIVHHWLHKDLHFSVIVEYVAIAILGLVLVFSLILRN